jgi:hypothetical protein
VAGGSGWVVVGDGKAFFSSREKKQTSSNATALITAAPKIEALLPGMTNDRKVDDFRDLLFTGTLAVLRLFLLDIEPPLGAS